MYSINSGIHTAYSIRFIQQNARNVPILLEIRALQYYLTADCFIQIDTGVIQRVPFGPPIGSWLLQVQHNTPGPIVHINKSVIGLVYNLKLLCCIITPLTVGLGPEKGGGSVAVPKKYPQAALGLSELKCTVTALAEPRPLLAYCIKFGLEPESDSEAEDTGLRLRHFLVLGFNKWP
jgi:hypothetical protein